MKRKYFFIVLFLILAMFLVGCGGGEKKVLPNISQEAIQMAIDQIVQFEHVKDAAVTIKDKTISLAVVTSPLVNKNYAKDVGESFVRLFGTFAAVADSELEAPTNDSYGGIYEYYDYEYYDLLICVGTGTDNIIVSGAKVTGAKRISW
jgi:hypothetical protein